MSDTYVLLPIFLAYLSLVSAIAITMATSSEGAATYSLWTQSLTLGHYFSAWRFFCWCRGMRWWAVTGRWGMLHTKNGEIDTSWDMNFFSGSWELEDRFVSLFPKMDCPEKHLLIWPLGRQSCEMERLVALGGDLCLVHPSDISPFPCFPSSSLLFLKIPSQNEVNQDLLSGESRLRLPCYSLLFLFLSCWRWPLSCMSPCSGTYSQIFFSTTKLIYLFMNIKYLQKF